MVRYLISLPLLVCLLFGDIMIANISAGVIVSVFILFFLSVINVSNHKVGSNLTGINSSRYYFLGVCLFILIGLCNFWVNRDYGVVGVTSFMSTLLPFLIFILLRKVCSEYLLLQVIKSLFWMYGIIVFSSVFFSMVLTGSFFSLRMIDDTFLVNYTFLFNPNMMGMHLLILYILSRSSIFLSSNLLVKFVQYAAPVMIVFTLSRSSLLAFVVCILPAYLFSYRKSFVALVVIIPIFVFALQSSPVIRDRFEHSINVVEKLSSDEDSNSLGSHRVKVISSMLSIIHDNWLHGVGFENIDDYMHEYGAVNYVTGNIQRVHGLFFKLFIGGGLLLIFAFVFLIVLSVRSAIKQVRLSSSRKVYELYFSILSMTVFMFFNTSHFTILVGVILILISASVGRLGRNGSLTVVHI